MPSKRKQNRSSSPSVVVAGEHAESSVNGAAAAGTEVVTSKEELAIIAANAVSSASPASTEQALEWCHQARSLWLNESSCNEDLKTVELLYRAALNAKRDLSAVERNKKRRVAHSNGHQVSYAALTPSDYRKAGERVSLLYLQSGRPRKAKPGLQYLGFTCRLAEKILNYPNNRHVPARPSLHKKTQKPSKKSPPCCIMDGFLSEFQLKYLQSIFCDINADYWTQHNYAVEPPSPYFSYVMPVKRSKKHQRRLSFLDSLIQQILRCQNLHELFPQLSKASHVELWAHNRPHPSGHQMHFDSDNEGIGGVRNPIISTILYLSENDDVGGPSLITNQTLQSTSLSNIRGWLAYSRQRRMVAFDGKVLHGVIPGKGVAVPSSDDDKTQSLRPPRRRVTLMLAFWKDIEVRVSSQPGAARPWPRGNKETPSWARKLNVSQGECTGSDYVCSGVPSKSVDPVPIGNVYEDLDGHLLPNGGSMPDYEQVFQGF